jgi:hypothetical protein
MWNEIMISKLIEMIKYLFDTCFLEIYEKNFIRMSSLVKGWAKSSPVLRFQLLTLKFTKETKY